MRLLYIALRPYYDRATDRTPAIIPYSYDRTSRDSTDYAYTYNALGGEHCGLGS